MRRIALTIGACVCLAALVAVAWAQAQLTPSSGQAPSNRVANEALEEEKASDALQPSYETVQKAVDLAQPGVPGAVESSQTGPANVPGPARVPTYQTAPAQVSPYFQAPAWRRADAELANPNVNGLLGQWKATEDKSHRDQIEKQLLAALKGEFQARLRAHEKEIEQLEAKVKRLREQLEVRRAKQDEIVDFRAQQLLREAQGLGWGTEPVKGLRPQHRVPSGIPAPAGWDNPFAAPEAPAQRAAPSTFRSDTVVVPATPDAAPARPGTTSAAPPVDSVPAEAATPPALGIVPAEPAASAPASLEPPRN